MVKEVEFANSLEIIDSDLVYSNSGDQPLFVGSLKDSGKTLNVEVHVELPKEGEGARQLYLFFGNIDFDNNLVDYTKLDESNLDYYVGGEYDFTNIVYEFDISKVLIIPRKIYNTQGSSEIVVELYTYESNITTDYGEKRLSVPYTITSDTKYEYDNSTDGIYKLVMIDYDYWYADVTYYKGDIVYFGGSILVSTIDDNNDSPDEDTWTQPTDEDIFNFGFGVTKNTPKRAIVSNVLISRFAKYNMIMDVLMSKSFKEYDNDSSNTLALVLQFLREKAKLKLMSNKPLDAAYNLQLLKLAYSNVAEKTAVRNFNIQYTI